MVEAKDNDSLEKRISPMKTNTSEWTDFVNDELSNYKSSLQSQLKSARLGRNYMGFFSSAWGVFAGYKFFTGENYFYSHFFFLLEVLLASFHRVVMVFSYKISNFQFKITKS